MNKAFPKIVLVTGYDWQGLYIDGKLVDQNHSIDVGDVISYLPGAEEREGEPPEDSNGFPENLADL